MESWRITWRQLVAALPRICAAAGCDGEAAKASALRGVLEMLKTDRPELTQGSTTTPPPLMCVQDWPVEAGDLIVWLGMWSGTLELKSSDKNGNPVASVGTCEEWFARACFEIDQEAGVPAACRWLLNWWDDTPRDEVRALLIPEVEFALNPAAGDPHLSGARAKLAPKPAASTAAPF
jgi:hypothetical protein